MRHEILYKLVVLITVISASFALAGVF